jgi:hypothetical protein
MGFLSRIVADAKAPAPIGSVTAPGAERTQAADAAAGWEVVETALSLDTQTPAPPPQSSPPPFRPPSRGDLTAPPSAVPPTVTSSPGAVRAPLGRNELEPNDSDDNGRDDNAPERNDPDRDDLPERTARAPIERRGTLAAPSPAPIAAARAAMTMTAPLVPSSPQPQASPDMSGGAALAHSRTNEAASRQAPSDVPRSRTAKSLQPERASVEQKSAAGGIDDRGGPARAAPQVETAAVPDARNDPPSRAAAEPLTPIPIAERGETFAPARADVAPSERAIEELRRAERPSPRPELVAVPRVHIGRLEVTVLAPIQPSNPSPQRSSGDLASRRYLRNA